MEPYIQISLLNDFIFCPRSIYFHKVYQSFEDHVYHKDIQIKGKIAHQSIDQKKYSTSKYILQGLPVYSNQYSLCGRVDIFNMKTGILTERKKQVKKIYDGFIFQIYAQYYCMIEMGYEIRKLFIYSLDNNKKFFIPLPKDNTEMELKFKNLLYQIDQFQLSDNFKPNKNKCKNCIYNNLCDYGLRYAQSA